MPNENREFTLILELFTKFILKSDSKGIFEIVKRLPADINENAFSEPY